jgi:hypothetical protein
VSRTRSTRHGAKHPKYGAKHPKPPKEIPAEEFATGSDSAGTLRSRRMCGDILSDPTGYDQALVRLCRRVSSR